MLLLSILLGLLLVSPARGTPAPANATGPVIDLGFAAYLGNATTPTGVENGPVTFFGGIPYAEPPLANLRWRAPKMLNESVPSESVKVSDARNYASGCIQQPAVTGVGSEDCLYLNVWMPANATNTSSLPVAFWIYGGGFFAGNTASYPMYDWVAQNPGTVAVSANYRLASLGFLAGPGIAADGDYNIGLLDQRAAMEWVQRHISSFGGNPDEVTIIGESAGAAAVVMQITAFGGNQTAPFKRAVTESIGYGPGFFAVSNDTDEIFANFTTAAGCPTDVSPVDIMACLRNATLDDLILGINTPILGSLSPVYGDAFVPDIPSQLFRDGRFTPVEYMGGHCSGDGHTFSNGSPTETLSEADIISEVFTGRWVGVTNETIQEVFEFYPEVNATGSPLHSFYDLGSEIGGDIVFSCMDEFIAGYMLDAGVKNVFTFVWNAPNPIAYASAPYQGAAHGSDVFFLFSGTSGGTFIPFNASEAILAEQAVGYWTSFVATGSPSTERATDSLAWPPYATSSREQMLFTRGGDTKTASSVRLWSDYKTSRCEWWFQPNITVQTAV